MQLCNISSPREIARLLGGEAQGQRILCPGPGHGPRDRSLSVRLTAGGGFVVHSFAGDDWQSCRDYVAERLGLGDWRQYSQGRQRSRRAAVDIRPFLTAQGIPLAAGGVPGADDGASAAPRADVSPTSEDTDVAKRVAAAAAIWRQTVPLPGTLAERYLVSRGLVFTDDLSHVLRFHPALYRDGSTAAGMVALFRDATTNEPCGVHRTFLDSDGRKLERRMLGRSKGAAIKLDADEDVSTGLHIGEGIETCLSARVLGLLPAWALGSAGAVADFAVLPGLEALTVLSENDEASASAADAVCERYELAGREASMLVPPAGDANDYLKGLAL